MAWRGWRWVAGLVIAALAIALGRHAWGVIRAEQVARRNEAARGGDAWQDVSTLRLTGRMDVGQGMLVPYVLEQKRPDKMRLEFVFDGQTAIQATTGDRGWKVAPFRGQAAPTPMTEDELREVADFASPGGILVDRKSRGATVRLVGQDTVRGRPADELRVTFPGGAERTVWVDAQTGLEAKVESTRVVAKRERKVETLFDEWQATDGLLVARKQETRTEGDPQSHVLTVESVTVNPPIDDARFERP